MVEVLEEKLKEIIDYLTDVVNENKDLEEPWLGFLKNGLSWLCLAYDELRKESEAS